MSLGGRTTYSRRFCRLCRGKTSIAGTADQMRDFEETRTRHIVETRKYEVRSEGGDRGKQKSRPSDQVISFTQLWLTN